MYVRCLTNQSAAIAYVTGRTYAVLTNQSTAIVYVTGCTYAFRPIKTQYCNDRTASISMHSLAQSRTASKIRVDRPLYYYSPKSQFAVPTLYNCLRESCRDSGYENGFSKIVLPASSKPTVFTWHFPNPRIRILHFGCVLWRHARTI